MYMISLYSLSIFLFAFNLFIKVFFEIISSNPSLMLFFILITIIGLTTITISWIKKGTVKNSVSIK